MLAGCSSAYVLHGSFHVAMYQLTQYKLAKLSYTMEYYRYLPCMAFLQPGEHLRGYQWRQILLCVCTVKLNGACAVYNTFLRK